MLRPATPLCRRVPSITPPGGRGEVARDVVPLALSALVVNGEAESALSGAMPARGGASGPRVRACGTRARRAALRLLVSDIPH